MRLLLRLYPAEWRARYEDEFLAVLEQCRLSPFDALDIALGALDARLRPRSLAIELAPRRNHLMDTRIAGYAAIVGGALILASLALSAPIFYALAAVALLVALIGLSAVQGRRSPLVTWAAVVIPVAGLFVSVVGLIGGAAVGDRAFIGTFSPWEIWIVGLMGLVVGSALFAAATLYVGVLSRSGAIALLAGSAAVLLIVPVLILGFGGGGNSPSTLEIALPAAAIVVFCAGWMWLGFTAAVRRSVDARSGAG